jgi:hypothetical protein
VVTEIGRVGNVLLTAWAEATAGEEVTHAEFGALIVRNMTETLVMEVRRSI